MINESDYMQGMNAQPEAQIENQAPKTEEEKQKMMADFMS